MLRRSEFQDHPIYADSHAFRVNSRKPVFNLILALPLLAFLLPPGYGGDKKPSHEEGRFDIYIAGKEIGEEQFSIQDSGDSVSSNSIVNFRDPGNQNRGVRIETQLNMDDKYMPRTYQVRTNIAGQKGAMAGTFVPGQAMFEYQANGNPRKSGVLVGDRYVILDTNVFHHFVFIGRLFDFAGAGKAQSLDVVIPQEMDSGILQISDAGIEKISVRGEKGNCIT